MGQLDSIGPTFGSGRKRTARLEAFGSPERPALVQAADHPGRLLALPPIADIELDLG